MRFTVPLFRISSVNENFIKSNIKYKQNKNFAIYWCNIYVLYFTCGSNFLLYINPSLIGGDNRVNSPLEQHLKPKNISDKKKQFTHFITYLTPPKYFYDAEFRAFHPFMNSFFKILLQTHDFRDTPVIKC